MMINPKKHSEIDRLIQTCYFKLKSACKKNPQCNLASNLLPLSKMQSPGYQRKTRNDYRYYLQAQCRVRKQSTSLRRSQSHAEERSAIHQSLSEVAINKRFQSSRDNAVKRVKKDKASVKQVNNQQILQSLKMSSICYSSPQKQSYKVYKYIPKRNREHNQSRQHQPRGQQANTRNQAIVQGRNSFPLHLHKRRGLLLNEVFEGWQTEDNDDDSMRELSKI